MNDTCIFIKNVIEYIGKLWKIVNKVIFDNSKQTENKKYLKVKIYLGVFWDKLIILRFLIRGELKVNSLYINKCKVCTIVLTQLLFLP